MWGQIPRDGLDILMTHGPPYGKKGGRTLGGVDAGCEILERQVINYVKPKYHIFGHIHEDVGVFEDAGIKFINACTVNMKYQAVNKAYVFEMEPKSGFTGWPSGKPIPSELGSASSTIPEIL